jgi:hypothetical protein
MVPAGNINPTMDGSPTAGTHAHYSRGDHVHPTDISRGPVNNFTFTGTLTAAMLSCTTVNINGLFKSTAKQHRIGTLGGTAMNGAVTPADANILFYDNGSGNWCGWGVDSNGNVWLRTGYSGTPAPVMYVRNDQVVLFRDSPTIPTPGASNDTRVANTAYVMARTGGGSFYRLDGGNTITGNVTQNGDLWVHNNGNYGVLYLGNTGSKYLQWDGSNYNLNGGSANASNGRLWGTNDFGGGGNMPWNNARLAYVADYSHLYYSSTMEEPYNGCATTGTSSINQGYANYIRRYRQFQCYTTGWFALGYA